MIRSKLCKPETVDANYLIEHSKRALAYDLGRIPYAEEMADFAFQVANAWCPVRRKNRHSRDAVVDCMYYDVSVTLSLAPDDSVSGMIDFLEIIENGLGVELKTSEDYDYRRFYCRKDGVSLSIYIYPKYSNSCSVVEEKIMVPTTKKTIVCR